MAFARSRCCRRSKDGRSRHLSVSSSLWQLITWSIREQSSLFFLQEEAALACRLPFSLRLVQRRHQQRPPGRCGCWVGDAPEPAEGGTEDQARAFEPPRQESRGA